MKEGINSPMSLDSILKDIKETDSRFARWIKLIIFGLVLIFLGITTIVLCLTLAPIATLNRLIRKGFHGTKPPQ